MRKVECTITKESFEDMAKAGRFNPSLEVTFRDKSGNHRHKISAGYSDEVYAFRQNGETYVLSRNAGLGYVGLEVFNGDDRTGEIFLEPHQVTEVLGRDDLAPFTIVRRLQEWICP